MNGVLDVVPGVVVSLDTGGSFVVRCFLDATTVQLEDLSSREIRSEPVANLRYLPGVEPRPRIDLSEVQDERWEEASAKQRYVDAVIREGGGLSAVEAAAEAAGVDKSTIYRWIKEFRKRNLMTDLYRKVRSDKGKRKLSEEVEALIKEVITTYHNTQEKRKPAATWRELDRLCKIKEWTTPDINTLKDRIASFDQVELAEARGEKVKANKRTLNKQSTLMKDVRGRIIQIDHTRVDLFLVDEEYRQAIGRPWITIAIDVVSRALAGWYISFDPPGTVGTGLCLSHAFLEKGKWMAELGIEYKYPCQGVPAIIHCDNAKEFHGNTLKYACEKYGAELRFRKIKKPNYGAHIERLNGTLMQRIHAIEGTSFSNSGERGDYDSEGRAIMTLREFERWFAHLVLGDYHNTPHSGISMQAPINVYSKSVTGESGLPTGGVQLITDPEELYYDFLPMERLTVQQYGAQWDYIQYADDILRKWVGAKEPGKPKQSRKFIFRRDPRDISRLFFFCPDKRKHFRIPYRILDRPHISLWELNHIRAYLKEIGKKELDEEAIFRARTQMRKIEEDAAAKTKTTQLSNAQKFAARRRESPQPKYGNERPPEKPPAKAPEMTDSGQPDAALVGDISAYGEIEDN